MGDETTIEEFKEFMLATSLEGQTAGADANAGRPLSPRAAQGSPLPVPGASSAQETQSHSEPIPQIRPHPERIAPLRERALAEGHKPCASVQAMQSQVTAEKTHRGNPIKRAKWHLGIRSQSKPQDIMNEVYRAMKTLDYEWKVINPYHVQVRRRKPSLDQSSKSETEEDSSKSSDEDSIIQSNSNTANPYYVKMSLQLYQVDYKSVPNVNNPQIPKPSSEKRNSLSNGNSGSRRESNHDVLGESADKENLLQAVNGCSSNGIKSESINAKAHSEVTRKPSDGTSHGSGHHHTMEFFEMCAAIITQLAR